MPSFLFLPFVCICTVIVCDKKTTLNDYIVQLQYLSLFGINSIENDVFIEMTSDLGNHFPIKFIRLINLQKFWRHKFSFHRSVPSWGATLPSGAEAELSELSPDHRSLNYKDDSEANRMAHETLNKAT